MRRPYSLLASICFSVSMSFAVLDTAPAQAQLISEATGRACHHATAAETVTDCSKDGAAADYREARLNPHFKRATEMLQQVDRKLEESRVMSRERMAPPDNYGLARVPRQRHSSTTNWAR